nr:hypothetical protein RVX_0313 [Nitratidesulfovibrio sp. HK-II]
MASSPTSTNGWGQTSPCARLRAGSGIPSGRAHPGPCRSGRQPPGGYPAGRPSSNGPVQRDGQTAPGVGTREACRCGCCAACMNSILLASRRMRRGCRASTLANSPSCEATGRVRASWVRGNWPASVHAPWRAARRWPIHAGCAAPRNHRPCGRLAAVDSAALRAARPCRHGGPVRHHGHSRRIRRCRRFPCGGGVALFCGFHLVPHGSVHSRVCPCRRGGSGTVARIHGLDQPRSHNDAGFTAKCAGHQFALHMHQHAPPQPRKAPRGLVTGNAHPVPLARVVLARPVGADAKQHAGSGRPRTGAWAGHHAPEQHHSVHSRHAASSSATHHVAPVPVARVRHIPHDAGAPGGILAEWRPSGTSPSPARPFALRRDSETKHHVGHAEQVASVAVRRNVPRSPRVLEQSMLHAMRRSLATGAAKPVAQGGRYKPAPAHDAGARLQSRLPGGGKRHAFARAVSPVSAPRGHGAAAQLAPLGPFQRARGGMARA